MPRCSEFIVNYFKKGTSWGFTLCWGSSCKKWKAKGEGGDGIKLQQTRQVLTLALASLEVTVQPMLVVFSSNVTAHLCLLSVGIKGVLLHVQLSFSFLLMTLPFVNLNLSFVLLFVVSVSHTYVGIRCAYVEVRRQLAGISSVFPPNGA